MQFHFKKRYPMNSRVGRIATLCLLILSVVMSVFALKASRDFDRRVASGELVQIRATVERITVTRENDDTDYDVWVSYRFEGREYENVHLSWYTSKMEEGKSTPIYVSHDAPDEPCGDPKGITMMVIPVFLGVSVLCCALAWIPRKKAE